MAAVSAAARRAAPATAPAGDGDPVAAVLVLDRRGLLALWQRTYGCPAPRNVSVGFLQRALGHAAQLEREGDVPARVLAALRRQAGGKAAAPGTAAALRPGVVLMREWNGRTWRVEVSEDGFLMDGTPYRSRPSPGGSPAPAGRGRASSGSAEMGTVRCAIYTRKSSEDGLEQQFNSLHAQREACAAYVASQASEGWVLLEEPYDDGGFSGGTLERPALQRLLAAVDAGRVDRIVVYKIDRLTRSLAGFAKIVERLDAAGASFVSVTQAFNTATSMGRLTLNMLLSFAQFEREVTAERIRDKIAASKRKGLWMGGNVPFGYAAEGRSLRIEPVEARVVRRLYDLYRETGSLLAVRDRAAELGLRSRPRSSADGGVRGGGPFGRGHIHHILTNPVYAGRIRHRSLVHEGRHPAIIPPPDWEAVQAQLQAGATRARGRASAAFASPLAGRLYDETGDRLTPSHSRKNGHRLRYYISNRLVADRSRAHPEAWRLPAVELERGIAGPIRAWALAPGQAARIATAPAAPEMARLQERLTQLAAELDGPHQGAALQALVGEVRLAPGRMVVALKPEGLADRLGLAADRLVAGHLMLEAPFRLRRRGVETKVVPGERRPEPDRVLIRNILKARDWFAALARGESYAEIAEREGVWKQRIQLLLPLASLAPDLVAAIAEGWQPVGLTTEALINAGLPIGWEAQRALVARL